ncbi:MAG: DNA/RNA non-specific endonuclease [Lachnospiraceae bacterium]|nr:DNA/RNA non-specific endonuclease [Lachnospiraceae bacterium]
MNKRIAKISTIIISVFLLLFMSGCRSDFSDVAETYNTIAASQESFSPDSVPAYSHAAYTVINNNKPYFTADDYTTESYEYYSELDSLGRCGVCMASIGRDLMPSEERGPIGNVRPSGWHTIKYDNIDGNYLYNRCHLIAYQLTGENANVNNLITGTRYLNVQGMLPFENMTADYIKETGNHVLYRATPVFDGDNLVADGVLLEGYSVEDNGAGICFNVFCYNVQPGIEIDYATGDSSQAEISTEFTHTYVLNTNTMKFHMPDCSSVSKIKEKNKQIFKGNRDDIIAQGYTPCRQCNP